MTAHNIDARPDEYGGLVPGQINADDIHLVWLPPSTTVEVSNFGDSQLHLAWNPEDDDFMPWRLGSQVVMGGETVQATVPGAFQDCPKLAIKAQPGSQTQYQIRRVA